MEKPIAVIDSGVGGLTVAREIMRQLPRERIVYFGDTARCPYGPRQPDEVKQYSYEMIDFLQRFQPKLLVVACNTATAVILEELQEASHIPVVGVIHPGVRAAIKATLTGRVGVIGTEGTIASQSYEQALRQIHPGLSISSLACPTLVPLVEEGKLTHAETIDDVQKALEPLQNQMLDTLILGCTHYPLLAPVIQQVMGEDVRVISSADETAREVSTILFYQNKLSPTFSEPVHAFYTSGKAPLFQKIAESWMHKRVPVIQHSWPTKTFSY